MGDSNFVLSQFEELSRLFIDGAVVVGFTLAGLGIYGFYKQTQFPQNFPFAKNCFMLIAGTMLIISGSIFQGFENTLFVQSEALDAGSLYMDVGAIESLVSNGLNVSVPGRGGLSSQMIPPKSAAIIIGFMYVIGVLAFLKGIYALKDAGEFTNPQGSSPVGKGIVFMVSGVLAVNINEFGCLIGSTFGTTLFCAVNS